ncbi:hypothetical protein ACHQM5_026395 [Ranunculus cassubicifolius]
MVFVDVIYCNSTKQFCAVLHSTGEVFAIDIGEDRGFLPRTTRIAPPTLNHWVSQRSLVETPSGDLLQVFQLGRSNFEVYLLDPIKRDWIQIHSLGDNALFLGNNSSMYLSATTFPGCKPNCIYYNFSWVYRESPNGYNPKESGIFNLESNSYESHYAFDAKVILSPPIWLEHVTKESL